MVVVEYPLAGLQIDVRLSFGYTNNRTDYHRGSGKAFQLKMLNSRVQYLHGVRSIVLIYGVCHEDISRYRNDIQRHDQRDGVL